MSTQEYPLLMWSALITVFIAIMALHIIENKQLKNYLIEKGDGKAIKKVLRFAWSRSIQLFFIVASLFTLISIHESQIRSLSDQLQAERTAKAIDTIISETKRAEEEEKLKAQQLAEVNRSLESTITSPVKNSIQDIFTSQKNADDSEGQYYNIKTRYEELLVNYFLLHNCSRSTESDYRIIMAALQKEMISAQAPPNLQNDILTAAQGSYEELYSATDCRDKIVESTASQYHNYLNILADIVAGTEN